MEWRRSIYRVIERVGVDKEAAEKGCLSEAEIVVELAGTKQALCLFGRSYLIGNVVTPLHSRRGLTAVQTTNSSDSREMQMI